MIYAGTIPATISNNVDQVVDTTRAKAQFFRAHSAEYFLHHICGVLGFRRRAINSAHCARQASPVQNFDHQLRASGTDDSHGSIKSACLGQSVRFGSIPVPERKYARGRFALVFQDFDRSGDFRGAYSSLNHTTLIDRNLSWNTFFLDF